MVAYRQPRAESELDRLRPKVTSSAGKLDAALLSDGAFATSTNLPKAPLGETCLCAARISAAGDRRCADARSAAPISPIRQLLSRSAERPDLEASDDGKLFRSIADIPGGRIDRRTRRVPRGHRALLPHHLHDAAAGIRSASRPRSRRHAAAESRCARNPRARSCTPARGSATSRRKAAFAASTLTLADLPTPDAGRRHGHRQTTVLDLTTRLRADGTLDWTPPAGSLDRIADGIFADRAQERPGVRRSHGPRGGQARCRRGARVFHDLSGSVPRNAGPADGRARPAISSSPTAGRRASRTGPAT